MQGRTTHWKAGNGKISTTKNVDIKGRLMMNGGTYNKTAVIGNYNDGAEYEILSTDDIGALINSLFVSYDNIKILNGNYLLQTKIIMGNSQQLIGQGFHTKISLDDSMNIDMLYSEGDRITIDSIYFDGNKANNSTGHGLVFFNAFIPVVRRCWIYDIAQDAITGDGDVSPKTSVLTIETCVIERAGRDSIVFNNNCQDPVILNTFTQDATRYGLHLNANFGSVITNSHFYRNNDHNVFINGGARHRFNNITADRSQNWSFYLTGSAKDVIIQESIIFDSNQSNTGCGGIFIGGGAKRNIITGNSIYDEQGVKTMDYGIQIDAGSKDNIVKNNIIEDIAVANRYIINDTFNGVSYHKDKTTTYKHDIGIEGSLVLGTTGTHQLFNNFNGDLYLKDSAESNIFTFEKTGMLIQNNNTIVIGGRMFEKQTIGSVPPVEALVDVGSYP